MSITVTLLAYKEAENLKHLLPQINEIMVKMGEPYEVIVVDTAEPTDNTYDICRENNVRYIPQEEPYYGGAFRTAIKYANYDRFLIIDADRSHDPDAIPEMYNEFDKGYDVVIGSRYIRGGISNDSTSSYLMSMLLNAVMRICIGVRVKDISSAYRLYDLKQLKTVTLKRANYDVLQEVILKMKLNKPKGEKLKISEVPITFGKRAEGATKRRLFIFVCSYIASVFILTGYRIKSVFRGVV